MNIVLTGSLGNISKPLAEQLIKAGHQVTIISSKADKAKAIEALGAKPAIGSVADTSFLSQVFKDAEAVYTMTPPDFSQSDYRTYTSSVGRNYLQALRSSGVKRVVNLSSIGAHLQDGTGPIKGMHDVESILNELDTVSVTHLRPGYFYFNFFGSIGMIKQLGIIGNNFGEDALLVLAHPADIAEVAARELQETGKDNKILYITSDERKAKEVATVLGMAINKPDLKWIEFSDEQARSGFIQAGIPEEIANNWVEMGTAVRSKILWEDYNLHVPVPGKRKLEDFSVEFAAAYKVM